MPPPVEKNNVPFALPVLCPILMTYKRSLITSALLDPGTGLLKTRVLLCFIFLENSFMPLKRHISTVTPAKWEIQAVSK